MKIDGAPNTKKNTIFFLFSVSNILAQNGYSVKFWNVYLPQKENLQYVQNLRHLD